MYKRSQISEQLRRYLIGKPLTKRSQGRPKYRWEDNLKQDIFQLKIQNWIACVRIEGNGNRSLRRPKLSTKGISAPGRRRISNCQMMINLSQVSFSKPSTKCYKQ
jgi:hypothetical protein